MCSTVCSSAYDLNLPEATEHCWQPQRSRLLATALLDTGHLSRKPNHSLSKARKLITRLIAMPLIGRKSISDQVGQQGKF
jgi:hypothetical protein